jgi:dipeptidyl aminopeptidase/acylaminoacyl peptidase
MVGVALMAAAALGAVANGRIAFTSFRDGGQGQIYTMAADGSDQRRVSFAPGYDAQPEFSPDGRAIAFRRGVSQDYEVWVMGSAGESPRRLTDTSVGSNSTQSSWLPDGSGLVFRRGPNRGTDVWRMAADGSRQQALVTAPGDQGYPTVSPAGGDVLFATTVDAGAPEDRAIQVSDASGIHTLRDLPGVYDSAPAWSPDGSRIAFESDADGDMDIYVMDADGSDVRQLTRNTEHDEGPVFSPDGTKLAFTRGENDVATDIWTMNADGSGQRQLTTTSGRDESPDWQAVPAPPATTTTPPATTTPPPATTAPRYRIALARRKPRLRTALRRGLRLRITASEPARLTARARGQRVARRAAPAGTRIVRLRFSHAARKRLREALRVTLTLRLPTARRTVTLRR